MSILTHDRILEEIKKGRLKILPFDEKCLGPGSYDLHLANEFRIFKRVKSPFQVSEKIDYRKITSKIKVKNFLILEPAEIIFGISQEKIKLPPDICAWIQGRSRFSRLGLAVYITASFIQPGTCNRQVLEITNLGPNTLKLFPGTKICQIIFERCEGKARYMGKFVKQERI